MRMLANTRACDGPISTVHTNTICMRFRLDPLSRVSSNRCAFHEKAERTSVNESSKCIEMSAFSYKNALVLMGRCLFVSCDCHLQVLISSLM